MITITPEQEAQLIKEAKAEFVARLIAEHASACGFVTPSQAAGILNVSMPTFTSYKLPRYLGNQYKLSEVLEYRKKSRE